MRLGNYVLATAAALSLVSTPVLAASAKTGNVSRVENTVSKKNEAGSGLFIGLLAAAAVVAGIVILSDDDSPSSP